MTLYMETTEIAPERTVAEIQKVLSKYGANAVMMEFEKNEVSAVAFRFKVGGSDVPFRLPCRWHEIAELLRNRAKISDYTWKSTWESDKRRRTSIEEKARRVAWRQILRWVEAQLALVETSMVKVEEVFFPYIQLKGNQTVFERFQEKGLAALEYKETN